MSNIHRLTIKNVKNLEEVDFTVPDGPMIYVTGPNAAGKTTVLDSLLYLLLGKKLIPDGVIRHGQDEAEIRGELTDGSVITRTITEKGVELEYLASDGRDVKRPQEGLNALVGPISMDPWKFCTMKPADQFIAIVQSEGLGGKIAEIDEARDGHYQDRRLEGREVKRLEGMLGGLEAPSADLPGEEFNVSADQEQLMEMRDSNTRRSTLAEKVVELEKQLDEARDKLVGWPEVTPETMEAIQGGITRKTEINRQLQDARQYRETETLLAVARGQHAVHEREYKALGDSKMELFKTIDLGVPGMKISEDNFLVLNDVPFELLNTAQKLKTACAFATKGDPELKIVRITDGSLLDADSQEFLSTLAKEKGYKIWVEMVRETGAAGLVLTENLEGHD